MHKYFQSIDVNVTQHSLWIQASSTRFTLPTYVTISLQFLSSIFGLSLVITSQTPLLASFGLSALSLHQTRFVLTKVVISFSSCSWILLKDIINFKGHGIFKNLELNILPKTQYVYCTKRFGAFVRQYPLLTNIIAIFKYYYYEQSSLGDMS